MAIAVQLKEFIMEQIDHARIIARARQMRAEDIRRGQGMLWARLRRVAGLAAASLGTGLIVLAELIRPAFSWNPQQHRHS